MEPTPDELAGVVELFGALTRAQLRRALAELAFKRGEAFDPERFAEDVAAALRSYHLVAVDATDAGVSPPASDETEAGTDTDEVLAVGPVAFPSLPEGARDLPHILDVPDRAPDGDAVARAAADRFRRDAATAIDAGSEARIRALIDASYDLEGWGGLDLSATRERMDDELAGK